VQLSAVASLMFFFRQADISLTVSSVSFLENIVFGPQL
jgi:hypothetical protein